MMLTKNLPGIVFISIFEFFFRNIRHRMTREIEEENIITADAYILFYKLRE